MKKELVFCGSCRHRKAWEAVGGYAGYKCKKKWATGHNEMKAYKQLIDCEEANKDNDCRLYEPDRFTVLSAKIKGFRAKKEEPIENRFDVLDL